MRLRAPAIRPSPEAAPVAENGVMPTASVERFPLPGETPSTPLANLFADRQIDRPSGGMPVDDVPRPADAAAWAAGLGR